MEVDAQAEAKTPQIQQADPKAARIPVPIDEMPMEVDAEAGAPAPVVRDGGWSVVPTGGGGAG